MNTRKHSFWTFGIQIIILLFFATGHLPIEMKQNPEEGKFKGAAQPKFHYIMEDSRTYLPIIETKPEKNIFGIQMESITRSPGLDLMTQARSGWTRRDYIWRLVEPVEGERNWSAVKYYEDELITATVSGINVVPILLDTPDWAMSPDAPCAGKVKPEKLQALANFVHDFVARYSRPPYNVKYVELWNEPDVDGFLGCWGDQDDTLYYGGESYGQMLKVVYPAAKAANPSIQVMVGGLLLDCDPAIQFNNKTCLPAYFLKGILQSGAGNSFDGIAFHVGDYYAGELGKYGNPNFGASWNTTGPVTTAKANFLRGLLAEYNVTGKFLLTTEAGIKCMADRCSDPAFGFEETKAYYLVEDGAAALAGGYRANIWFSMYGDKYSGILNADNTPLPAYHAFKFMRNKLVNRTFVRNITGFPGVVGYEFQSAEGQKVWVVWSLDGQNHILNLTVNPTSIERISPTGLAANLTVQMTVLVGVAPVFITF